jgi:hypothetical protein
MVNAAKLLKVDLEKAIPMMCQLRNLNVAPIQRLQLLDQILLDATHTLCKDAIRLV